MRVENTTGHDFIVTGMDYWVGNRKFPVTWGPHQILDLAEMGLRDKAVRANPLFQEALKQGLREVLPEPVAPSAETTTRVEPVVLPVETPVAITRSPVVSPTPITTNQGIGKPTENPKPQVAPAAKAPRGRKGSKPAAK